jgi:putative endonuclease
MLGLFDFLHRKKEASPKLSPRQVRGREGEAAAEAYLKRCGHRILARNVTYARGEVDLVAQEKRTGTLCFVEVRSRDMAAGREARVSPEESVTLAKRRRVISAARKYMADRHLTDVAVRFDVVAVRYTDGDRQHPEVKHYPNAFDVNGKLM